MSAVPRLVTRETLSGHGDIRRIAAKNPSSTGDRTMPTEGVLLDTSLAVVARVNQGRWIADCPNPVCGGAELVSFDNPFFFCCECRNAQTGNAPLPITVPKPQKARDIEAYLRARPDVATRNWDPDQTVADLRDENRARGILLLKDKEG